MRERGQKSEKGQILGNIFIYLEASHSVIECKSLFVNSLFKGNLWCEVHPMTHLYLALIEHDTK